MITCYPSLDQVMSGSSSGGGGLDWVGMSSATGWVWPRSSTRWGAGQEGGPPEDKDNDNNTDMTPQSRSGLQPRSA